LEGWEFDLEQNTVWHTPSVLSLVVFHDLHVPALDVSRKRTLNWFSGGRRELDHRARIGASVGNHGFNSLHTRPRGGIDNLIEICIEKPSDLDKNFVACTEIACRFEKDGRVLQEGQRLPGSGCEWAKAPVFYNGNVAGREMMLFIGT